MRTDSYATLPPTHEPATDEETARVSDLQAPHWIVVGRAGYWYPLCNARDGDFLAAAKPRRPAVGLGVTVQVGSDEYAGTIIEVSPSGHRFVIQYDDSRALKGHGMYSGDQRHLHVLNEAGRTKVATYRAKHGRWMVRGITQWVTIGIRETYLDPSF